MRPSLASSLRLLVLLSISVTKVAASAELLDYADIQQEARAPQLPAGEQSNAPIILSPFLPGIDINVPQAVLPIDNHQDEESYRRNDYSLPNANATAAVAVANNSASAATPARTAPATTPAPTTVPYIYKPVLEKRQGGTTCPTSYSACAALGAPGLCCRRNTNCALDQAGHVACCPVNAACTGTIRGSSVAGGYSVSTTTLGTAASSIVRVTTTDSTGGFVAVGTTFVATPNAAGRVAVPWLLGWF
ncbi:uncharacterized protein J3D65DRAFT_627931 [Phyllosticta citribraziliensis]|uniref:Uncharacterized protein n=1 Tax=Phyllosticta citribraziliensis TaxID=989973 RepID=A0ABR1LNG0_9PEZI